MRTTLLAWAVVAVITLSVLGLAARLPDAPHECPLPPSDTASVVYERKMDECMEVVRLCAIVVRQYEDGATVCRGD